MRRWACSGRAGKQPVLFLAQADFHRLVGGRDDGLRIAARPPRSRAPRPRRSCAALRLGCAKAEPDQGCDDRQIIVIGVQGRQICRRLRRRRRSVRAVSAAACAAASPCSSAVAAVASAILASLIAAPPAEPALDLVQRQVGEQSQEAPDIGIGRIPPELPIIIGAQLVGVEPHRALTPSCPSWRRRRW